MKTQIRKFNTVIFIFLAVLATLLTSCDMNKAEDPQPEQSEMIEQSFNVISSYSMGATKKGALSFDPALWLYNYCTIAATMTLQGTGAASANVYTQSVTIAQLQAGEVVFNMFAGTYDATFKTVHRQTTDAAALAGFAPMHEETQVYIGEELDISVNNSIEVFGTPVSLTAALEDFLIVVDIPSVTEVKASVNLFQSTDINLMYNAEGDFHWGYLQQSVEYMNASAQGSAQPLQLRFTVDGVVKTVDCSLFVAGRVYQIITPFGGTVELDIPDMTLEQVII